MNSVNDRKILWMFLSGFILSVSNLLAQHEIKLSEELFLSKLNEKVYVVTHYFPWQSNSLIVKASNKEVVLIDTPYHDEATALVTNWIDKKWKPEKIVAINTGFHVDNLGGNQYLRQKGIDIYGADRTCALLDERSDKTRKQLLTWLKPDQENIKEVYRKMSFTKPNKTFSIDKGIVLSIGELTFEAYFPGETHSPDNLVVYISQLKILFGGCMVKSLASNKLGFTGDANLAQWPVSMRNIRDKYKEAKIVIPHHGFWGDRSLIDHTILLLETYELMNK